MEWAQSLKLIVEGRGKLGYLTGEVKKQEKDGQNGRLITVTTILQIYTCLFNITMCYVTCQAYYKVD